jgi:hypothetical protein
MNALAYTNAGQNAWRKPRSNPHSPGRGGNTNPATNSREDVMRKITVDPKAYELAQHFLSDVKGSTAKDIDSLAQEIQLCCEGFCTAIEEIEGAK